MLHLLGETKLDEPELLKRCVEFADEKGIILILKGAPTLVFSPDQLPFILDRGDPGMATAGSGDVLTGIIAAMLAQGKAPLEAALLGVTLHGLSGEVAAQKKTSYGYTAGDLIDCLPDAFRLIPQLF
jgi:NAD(P)H-hydrate epimerase